MKKWNDCDIKILKKKNQYTAIQLSKLLNRSVSSIQAKLFNLGIKSGPLTKCRHNEDFFDILNNTNCYWAGFIAADGYIDQNRLGITISSKDKNHLKRFAKDIKYNGNILDSIIRNKNYGKSRFKKKEYYTSSLVIGSAINIIKKLNDIFNITPRKSFTLKSPNINNLENILSYIVGYIDGDGTVYVDNKNRMQLSIVSGSKDILDWILSIFNQISPTNYTKRTAQVRKEKRKSRKSNTYCIKITGYRAQNICHILNMIKVPRLQRKWKCISNYRYIKNRSSDKWKNRFETKLPDLNVT